MVRAKHGAASHAHTHQGRHWTAWLSGLMLGATALLVVFQLRQAHGIAGAGSLRAVSRRKLHRVVPHTEYRAALAELLEHSEPHYVAFTSGLGEGGRPWCGDCAVAMPLIREVVLAAGGSLLEVSSGERGEWSDRQHPLRIDPDCPVRYIPTLYSWSASGCGSSIANPLSSDEPEEALRLLVAKFVQQTAAGKRYVDRITSDIIKSGGKGCGGC